MVTQLQMLINVKYFGGRDLRLWEVLPMTAMSFGLLRVSLGIALCRQWQKKPVLSLILKMIIRPVKSGKRI